MFGAEQFTWLFSSAFLRSQQEVQETIAPLASNPNPVEPEAYDRQEQAYLQFVALDRLGGIEAPSLVIVGEQDLLTPPWVAREVTAGIPGAQFEIAAGDGSPHVVPLERPDHFNRLVINFLPTDVYLTGSRRGVITPLAAVDRPGGPRRTRRSRRPGWGSRVPGRWRGRSARR